MTRDDEEIMKLRQAFAAPVAAAWNIEGCPEPDRIWSAVRGELPPDEIREILDHVALCASCAEDWRLAMAFEQEARADEIAEERKEQKKALVIPIQRYRPWIAAAAAAVVVTVAALLIPPPEPQGPPVYRGGETRIEAVVAPEQALPRNAFMLTWKPVEGAESYNLLVTTEDLAVVANLKGLTTASHQIPAGDLARLASGTTLHWTVTAVFPDGGTLPSPLFRNRIQ